MKTVKNICLSLKRYSFLLEQLISRDFKVKYKRSVLGVLLELTESDSDDVRYGNRIYQCIQVLDTGSKLPDVFADGSCIF